MWKMDGQEGGVGSEYRERRRKQTGDLKYSGVFGKIQYTDSISML